MMKYSVMDLGSLGGGGTAACGINDLGQVVGKSNTVNVQTHAFRTAPNSPINLATDDLGALFPGGLITQAMDINDSDQVVGKSGNRAFIYTEGMMYDLNDLISYDNPLSLQLGWVELSEANAINNKGRIVYEGFSYSSLSGFKPEVSSFLLTPISGRQTTIRGKIRR